MFGGYEWVIVLVVIVLLLFGSKKIPEFVRSLGMAVAEFKRGRMMIEKEINEEMQASSTRPERKVTKKLKKKQKKVTSEPSEKASSIAEPREAGATK